VGTNILYYHKVVLEDRCPKCNEFLIHGIWNPKLEKVSSWCPTCDPEIIKDCVVKDKTPDNKKLESL